ncbi:PI31 proteasome regulator N-terminal-domain-containing protein [Xylariaceae sp. AK1471]|nr:PI31 proteasome regulator N-terminal-domain-containing protein [Xylariaceae sp. AK1471]
MSTNPLGPSTVLQSMADALSTHMPHDTTSDLSSSHEALALFTHACMTSLGFRLLGFDEDKLNEAECHGLAPRLPANWNASFNTYSFVYAHQQSALRFVIKIDRMGGKAEIRGLAKDDERIARLSVTIKDYVSNAALPVRITMTNETEDRSDLQQKFKDVFISQSRIGELANQIKVHIVQSLLPSLHKEGYEESPAHVTARRRRDNQQSPDDRAALEDAQESARRPPRQPPVLPNPMPGSAQPYPFDDPLHPQPRQPIPAADFPPPGFEDPYDLNRNRQPPAGGFWPGPLRNIGDDDLHPPGLGPHDPLRGGVGAPGGNPLRQGGTRGMHPTFDDFLSGGQGGMPEEVDPQVPLGARYDPIGPGGVPRLGGRRPGGGNNPFGGGQGGFGGYGGFGGGDFI